MLEGGRAVFLEEEVPDPGKAVTGKGQGQQQKPVAAAQGKGEQGDDQAGTDKVQATAGGVAVLAQVVGVELGKTAKLLRAVHDTAPGSGRSDEDTRRGA
ncbi:hypothetical protein D9M73_176390 [compost metagenome]